MEIGYVIANMLHGDQATPEEQMFTLSLDTLPTIVLLLNYHKAVVDDRLRIALLNALGKVFQLSIELQMQYIDIFTHLEGNHNLLCFTLLLSGWLWYSRWMGLFLLVGHAYFY